MKKLLNLMGLLLLVLVIASPVYAKEVPITEENIGQLRGKWEGYRRGMGQAGKILELSSNLEIFNDRLPLEGELIHYNVRGGGDQSLLFNNGIIEKEKLFIKWNGYWIRLSLHVSKKGKMELRGEDTPGWDLKFFKK